MAKKSQKTLSKLTPKGKMEAMHLAQQAFSSRASQITLSKMLGREISDYSSIFQAVDDIYEVMTETERALFNAELRNNFPDVQLDWETLLVQVSQLSQQQDIANTEAQCKTLFAEDEEDDGTLGRYLARLRKKRGLSQEQMGKLCGSNQTVVSRWELNQSRPSFRKLRLIAAALGVSIDTLLAKIDNPS